MLHAPLEAPASPRFGLPPWTLAVLLAGFALRVAVIVSAPVQEVTARVPGYNDEASHLNHVLFQMGSAASPQQRYDVTVSNALERGEAEYGQPPLYYWIAAGWLRLFRSVRALRLLSLILWGVSLLILLRAAPPGMVRVSLALAGGLLGAGLIPSATINNDALLALAVAILYSLSASAVKRTLEPLDRVNLGLAAAFGVWCKLSALALWPMALAAAFLGTNGTIRKKSVSALLVLVVALWFSMPLWVSRTLVYGGPLAFSSGAGQGAIDPLGALKSVAYSLVSPWMALWPSWLVKIPGLLLALILAILGLSVAVEWIRKGPAVVRKMGPVMERVATVWAVGAAGGLIGWLYSGLRYGQIEARLLLPGAPGFALLLALPLMRTTPRKARLLLGTITLLMAVPYLAWGMR